jgi:cobyrinic acid a,c-diamide synthase
VLDARSMSETAAAVALGIKQMDLSGSVVGVILNNVPSDYRRRVVEDAVWALARLPVLGALPRIDAVQIPELRTGLLPLTQNPNVDAAIEQLGRAVQRDCDVDIIERLMARAHPLQLSIPTRVSPVTTGEPVRVGVAFDDAFCFYYPENLELVEAAGAEIVPFSPLEDRSLPRDIDAAYLGGGVSEAYLPRLAANRGFVESLRRAHAHGLPIYGECGGLMVCARSVRTSDGSSHDMAGIIPIDLAAEAGALHSGYRDLRVASSCLLGPAGTRLRGHEFHFLHLLSGSECLNPVYSMHDSDGEPLGCEGWTSGNIVASFIHLHFGQDERLAPRLVEAARSASAQRRSLTGDRARAGAAS